MRKKQNKLNLHERLQRCYRILSAVKRIKIFVLIFLYPIYNAFIIS